MGDETPRISKKSGVGMRFSIKMEVGAGELEKRAMSV